MSEKIAIIGSGSWGTALAQVLADNNHDVLVWGRNMSEVVDIRDYHKNTLYFNDLILNENIKASINIESIKGYDYILLAVPTAAVESICEELNYVLDAPVTIINVAKGFHPTTHQLLSDVIKTTVEAKYLKAVVSLIGPSHAENVVLRQHTAVNSVSDNEQAAKDVQFMFSNDYFRVYRTTDVIGAQIGVAIKNIIAVASGIAEGLNLGDNARAALITRGLAEMSRFGVSHGGLPETFIGLCGVGDLVVTASSFHSRNFQAGLQIGEEDSAKRFLETNTKTVEGIHAAKVVHELSIEENISMPITEQVYKIVYENKKPSLAIEELMMRDLKQESI
ncbi:NAD(P)H-dependent glycerol-3-phosphate dehydrogenase [Erysipelothrix urinaevulpis]|uniref:NAD(P)H-dependent glycerol-3-phosphate dehydrogenase n=1 Tax=Erysipelothrix urinaevulpis TaxID=2683717 RepID=UPI0013590144|nr:NAD(P)H-dependent glycerol-3-phosphate dehydrogenase [Erysipelothrix urinaevulpis]